MADAKCIGSLCPPSLDALNTPKFVIRAGIIPYRPPTNTTPGRLFLGVKEGKYTDFGGGCKGSKLELPFDCAVREMKEETGSSIGGSSNITHIFVSGKNKPHQLILLVKTDTFEVPKKIPQGELEKVVSMTFAEAKRVPRRLLHDSLKPIYDNLVAII